MNKSTLLARVIATQLIESGISDVVVSPGSRSAPLSIALFQAEKAGLVQLHIRIDERTAAFFALGIAKASGKPVALLCTSGTAAANYFPAILEASHSQVPLLIITADRPERLRNTGANQTTNQVGMYGSATPVFADISDSNEVIKPLLTELRNGPVHLNLQFDEPLLPEDGAEWCEGLVRGEFTIGQNIEREVLSLDSDCGVLVIGHDRGGFTVSQIEKFATQVGWPVIAEDPSTISFAVPHASLFLSSEKIRKELRPEIAIVIGRTTLSRSTNAFVKQAGIEIVIDPRIHGVDGNRGGDLRFSRLPEVSKVFVVNPKWSELWDSYGRKSASVVEKLPDWSEGSIARHLLESLPNGTSLYVSSSRPVRDIEAFVKPRSGLETFANRGLSGIDGNVSTSLGIASQRKGTVAILGDLSFLHDITGLIGADAINLRILVINNDGGGIFSTLPQASVDGFEKIFGTPHGLDLERIASAFGVETITIGSLSELHHEMLQPISGISVVIAKVPGRQENAKVLDSLYEQFRNL